MKKLSKKVKDKWVKALLSGKYEQGKEKLYNTIDNTYCCLGVAREIGCADPLSGPDAKFWVSKSFLPMDIQKKLAEFNDGTPDIDAADTHDKKPKSFKWIASYIKRYL